ncbi:MAG: site-specific DNA-methyltransferase [Pseudomonadota bacterium]
MSGRVVTIGNCTLIEGDCEEVAKTLAPVSAVVTDPPYGLEFMGSAWDSEVPPARVWGAISGAMLPGAHLLAFAGTRTQHKMATAIETAGFEIRDMISWLYGTGFPKSRNVGRDVEGMGGWGTALKPACEPVTVARKPITEKSVARQVLATGTGAINVDGCRVETEDKIAATRNIALGSSGSRVYGAASVPGKYEQKPGGRFPANVVHDGSEEVLAGFPESAGQLAATSTDPSTSKTRQIYGAMAHNPVQSSPRGDKGSAARFFYCAKASRKERGAGNNHPTVKPVALMAWLVRLVTPRDGVVLDPFMGSGTTALAAIQEGRPFVGIERDPDFFDLSVERVRRDTEGGEDAA